MFNFTVLAIILLLVVIAYLAIFVMQRTTVKKVSDLRARKDQLESLKVREELVEGRKLPLTGQSLKNYQKFESSFNDVQNNKFLKIDQQANLVLFEARGINFIKTRNELERLQGMVDDTETTIKDVRAGLLDLKKTDEEHREAINDLKKKYEGLRKRLLAENFKFGPANPALDKFLSQLEADYDEFTELTENGDHATASDIYEQLAMETTQMEKMMADIPDLFDQLNIKYVDQLNELAQGHTKLVEAGYVFPNDSVEQELQAIDSQRQQVLNLLADLKLKEVTEQTGYIEQRIDAMYETMETEVTARKHVTKNADRLSSDLLRLREQNQTLSIELDRLGQSFQFNHKELETRRTLLEQINMAEEQINHNDDLLEAKEISYSELQIQQEKLLKQFEEIETQQVDIWDKISGLEKADRSARQLGGQYQKEVEAIKHAVERMNLPGLPVAYLEYFYAVSNELKRLAKSLNTNLIDMDEVQRQLNIVSADIDTLKEKTEEIVDQAALTEQLLQYANRYRASNERVAAASEQARMFYERDYNFKQAMDILGSALDSAEPGVYERLVDSYMRRKTPLV
ncbi:MAG: septation ring formation regulator EzrA [Leuconostoc mesenteroides]|jgi:septation ring formation regulator|uniref:Septation ring formation regulator EzrA n=2 Tax=Leuconostoc mesenteroides TaxID=1245 RepID=A0A378M859_LEUME|nr:MULTISPECIES: septation ring formation regulator EzrA [Leuconostoc]ABJ62918.1 Negative regulator of septation ring formation [Leuconostoc mesenteroides subsp. mesenteroides ATCC 8293]AET31038.1 selenide, water dikinase [Leuconostoc mesenteroides subsp. mesenteroides J18]AQU49989.1 septation ring formation regulator EzrA [Leuconostoc mesenteroides subsp. mesenteroides]ARN64250.1 septation ring formation regulator EzrA [Leuconostoc mesenteroides subsp. mesenteroides]KAA8348950.1 septation rin